MKKWTLLLLSLTLTLFVLAGCGSTEEKTTASETETTQETASESTDAVEPLKAILLIPGTLGDKSFFDAADAGMKLVESELGATVKVVEMGSDQTKWEPNFLDAVDGDWDVIISGNNATELMYEIAEEYPDENFINFDTDIEETPSNVYAMFYSTNEVSFMAGAAASLITTSDMENANEEPVIGFLGGMDIPGINDFLVGFIEGAQYVNPDVKISVSYAGTFSDPAKGKELSLVMYNAGADIIFNVAGGTGLGILDAAKETGNYAIGVDSDQALLFKDSDPEKASLILTSAVKNIDNAILNAVKSYQDGTIDFGVHQVMGIAVGGVGLANNEYYQQVPEDIRVQLEALTEEVTDGTITVDSAYGMTTEEITSMRESVQP